MPSEVGSAVQAQRANNNAQLKRDNIRDLIKRINDGLPVTLQKMREHHFPVYKNRGFEESQERVAGKLMPVWKFKNAIAYQRVIRGTTSLAVEVPGADTEFGIVFKENASGQATHTIVVGRWNQRDDFRIVAKADYLRMDPDQVNAIRAVLDEMQKPPSPPKHVVPDI